MTQSGLFNLVIVVATFYVLSTVARLLVEITAYIGHVLKALM